MLIPEPIAPSIFDSIVKEGVKKLTFPTPYPKKTITAHAI
jgi:hypothetical protein